MSRKALGALAAVFCLAGIVVAAATFAGARDRSTFTQAGSVRSVDVDVEAGRIHVVAGEGETTIHRTRRYLFGAPTVEETLVDGVLRVRAECGTPIELRCAVDYRLEVPAGISLRVRTDRGSVTVEGITGTVDVETGAGGVRLAGTRGPLQLQTSAGSIEGDDVVAGFVDAGTDAGRIRLSLAEPSGRVDLRTDAGSIDLALPLAPGGYRVTTETRAGDVEVSVDEDPEAGRAVTARTGAGDIRVRPR